MKFSGGNAAFLALLGLSWDAAMGKKMKMPPICYKSKLEALSIANRYLAIYYAAYTTGEYACTTQSINQAIDDFFTDDLRVFKEDTLLYEGIEESKENVTPVLKKICEKSILTFTAVDAEFYEDTNSFMWLGNAVTSPRAEIPGGLEGRGMTFEFDKNCNPVINTVTFFNKFEIEDPND